MSRNQKEIKAENFKKLWWRYEDGKLKADTEIRRKPFGDFKATFRMNTENGATVLEVRNEEFPLLNRTAAGYDSFESAVEALRGYFEEVEGVAKKIPQSERNEAERARRTIISSAVAKIKREANDNGTV